MTNCNVNQNKRTHWNQTGLALCSDAKKLLEKVNCMSNYPTIYKITYLFFIRFAASHNFF